MFWAHGLTLGLGVIGLRACIGLKACTQLKACIGLAFGLK